MSLFFDEYIKFMVMENVFRYHNREYLVTYSAEIIEKRKNDFYDIDDL